MPVWENDDYDPLRYYDDIRREIRSCWYCNAERAPVWWYAPWLIERAHIVNKPRRTDRRVVVMLCSTCHKRSHGERFSGVDWPILSVANMLWLKLNLDPDWWDPAFLQKQSIRRLPEPEMPAKFQLQIPGGDVRGKPNK